MRTKWRTAEWKVDEAQRGKRSGLHILGSVFKLPGNFSLEIHKQVVYAQHAAHHARYPQRWHVLLLIRPSS